MATKLICKECEVRPREDQESEDMVFSACLCKECDIEANLEERRIEGCEETHRRSRYDN